MFSEHLPHAKHCSGHRDGARPKNINSPVLTGLSFRQRKTDVKERRYLHTVYALGGTLAREGRADGVQALCAYQGPKRKEKGSEGAEELQD